MDITKYLLPDQLELLNNCKGRKRSATLIALKLELMGVIDPVDRECAIALGYKAYSCKDVVENIKKGKYK